MMNGVLGVFFFEKAGVHFTNWPSMSACAAELEAYMKRSGDRQIIPPYLMPYASHPMYKWVIFN
jgi:hypothetical protein